MRHRTPNRIRTSATDTLEERVMLAGEDLDVDAAADSSATTDETAVPSQPLTKDELKQAEEDLKATQKLESEAFKDYEDAAKKQLSDQKKQAEAERKANEEAAKEAGVDKDIIKDQKKADEQAFKAFESSEKDRLEAEKKAIEERQKLEKEALKNGTPLPLADKSSDETSTVLDSDATSPTDDLTASEQSPSNQSVESKPSPSTNGSDVINPLVDGNLDGSDSEKTEGLGPLTPVQPRSGNETDLAESLAESTTEPTSNTVPVVRSVTSGSPRQGSESNTGVTESALDDVDENSARSTVSEIQPASSRVPTSGNSDAIPTTDVNEPVVEDQTQIESAANAAAVSTSQSTPSDTQGSIPQRERSNETPSQLTTQVQQPTLAAGEPDSAVTPINDSDSISQTDREATSTATPSDTSGQNSTRIASGNAGQSSGSSSESATDQIGSRLVSRTTSDKRKPVECTRFIKRLFAGCFARHRA